MLGQVGGGVAGYHIGYLPKGGKLYFVVFFQRPAHHGAGRCQPRASSKLVNDANFKLPLTPVTAATSSGVSYPDAALASISSDGRLG